MTLQADVTLIDGDLHRMEAGRIALLEAVERTGSIAAAARQMGLSYKAAWDSLDAMAHLTNQPLLQTVRGGRGGGGAQLSPAGVKLIKAWSQLQSGLAELMQQFQNDLHTANHTNGFHTPNFTMITSARNVFLGTIANIIPLSEQQDRQCALLVDVCLDLGNDLFIHSAITRKSVKRLELECQRPVHALIKASFVKIIPQDNVALMPDKNRLCGTICDFAVDDRYTEITVDLGQNRSITATCLKQQAIDTGLEQGLAVTAQFSPEDVIIATH